MARKNKYTIEQVIDAIRESKGILTVAARKLDCSRSTLQRYVSNYPTVTQAVNDERESLLDFAEGSLFDQVRKGNITAIIFTLKTIGKSRGYVERQELSGPDGSGALAHADLVSAIKELSRAGQ